MSHISVIMSTLISTFLMLGCAASTPNEKPTEPVIAEVNATATDVNQTAETSGEIVPELRLQEVYWKLIGVEGKAVIPNAHEREAYIILKLEGQRLQGFGGCNILMGSYTLDEKAHKVRFSRVASTMMACPRLADESAFLKALEKVEQFSIQDGVLLLQKEGKTIATFESSFQP